MNMKRSSLILALALVCSIALAGSGILSPALAASDYYASCTACHALPLLQAKGDIGGHGGWGGPPPPGFVDDACMMQCHEGNPPEGHPSPSYNPFLWQTYLDPFSYPPGPSVSQQMCATCHAVGFPPLDALHTHDQIPYLPSATTPPTSVLPLYQGDGPWNQDPTIGGLVCSTCHDPHDPSYVASSNGKQSYLRVGGPSGDITPLCSTCHSELAPATVGYDLYIDSDPLSVWFTRPVPEWIEVQVIVRNRGNAPYPGGLMEIQIEDWLGGDPFPVDTVSLPPIPADGSAPAWFWIPDFFLWEGSEVVHFVLEPSPLNPVRTNTFVRSFALPPAPENLRVNGTDYQSVSISWDPPLQPGPAPVTYDVYRNGIKVNSYPLNEWQTFFTDMGLPPETPHTYTVAAVSEEGFPSPMSNRVGALTDWGIAELRVPQDYPTIQSAVDAASPGTTIRVAPGTYSDFMYVGGQQIAIKGQDANVCTIDLTLHGSLDMTGGWSNSLSGFTIKGGVVQTSPMDVISQCVFQSYSGPNIRGGGFVTNSIFDQTSGPVIELMDQSDMLTVANSIFMSDYPFYTSYYPEEQLYLINNAFPNWGWEPIPGENNNSEYPYYTAPGPPDRYFIDFIYPFWDGGADVGLPFMDAAPDIGVFEANMTYTAKPAANLTADPLGPALIKLNWSPSPDEDLFPVSYEIYKSEWPDFPGSDDEMVYDTVNPGTTTYDDFSNNQGTTYYYKVRAFTVASSEASNTASAIAGGTAPTAVDDSYSTDEDTSLYVPAPGVTGNDSDPDGDNLWATLVSAPSFAQSFTLFPDGSFDYTPLPGYSGPDSFTYTVDDGVNTSNTATVDITVNFINFPPDAVDDSYTLYLAAPNASFPVLFNDSDPDGDPLTVIYVSPPDSGGTATNRFDHIDYSPAPGFIGVETFIYDIDDGQGGMDTAQVTVTVLNDPPVASDDFYSVDEDTLLSVAAPGVLANDSDINGHSLTASLMTAPAWAQNFNLSSNGTFFYDPNPNFHGSDSFTYRVTDVYGDSDTATVFITVDPAADTPVAGDDAYAVDEDGTLNVAAPGVLGNDSDGDGDPLTAVLGTDVSSGSLTLNPDGSFSYTPNADYNGPDSFTYSAFDGVNSSAPATVSITVFPVPDTPTAAADAYSVDEDATLNVSAPGVLANDADADSDPLTATLAAGVSSGSLTLNPDGSFSYTPNAEFSGSDSFTYTAYDGMTSSTPATVTITVSAVPDTPVAGDDAYSVDEDATLNVAAPGVLANDTDADGDTLTTALVTGVSSGNLNLNLDGSFDYTPNAEFNGSDSFTYSASDGANSSAPATVVITVNSVNDIPLAADDAYSAQENILLSVAAPGVLGNDSDPEGEPITAVPVTGAGGGTLVLNPDGSFDYTSNAGFYGPDSFTYSASDGVDDSAPATVTIDVNGRPVAVDDSGTMNEGENLTVNLVANDSDPDGDAFIVLSIFNEVNAGVVNNNNGTVTVYPSLNFNGPVSFTYRIRDSRGGMDTADVFVDVLPVNDFPLANPDALNTSEDSSRDLDVVANDTDIDGDTLTITGVGPASNGTATVVDSRTVRYVPDPDFNGQDLFEYYVTDGTDTSTGRVYCNVNAINDAPVLQSIGPQSVAEAGTLSIALAATDVDGDGLSFSATGVPAFCTLSDNGDGTGSIDCTPGYDDAATYPIDVTVTDDYSIPETDSELFDLTVTGTNRAPTASDDAVATDEDTALAITLAASDPDGDALTWAVGTGPSSGALSGTAPDLTYTPNADFNGSDSFTFTAHDGTVDSNTATVSITVNAVNDAPVADSTSVTTDEDTALAITLTAFDVDGDALTFTVTAGPSSGTLSGTAPNLTYTPDAGYNGTDSFTFTVNDGTVDSSAATVLITVNSVNDAPVADDQAIVTDEDTAVGITLTASDLDGDSLTYAVAAGPANGSLSGTAPNLTYTPNADFNGSDSFTFTANDGTASSNTATVSITVNAVNDAPAVADPGAQNNTEGDTVSLQISANDADGDTLFYSATGLPADLSIDPGSGLISGTLTFDSAGGHSVTVAVTDGTAPTDVLFTWNVTDVQRMHVESITTGTYENKGKTYYTAQVLLLDDGGAPVSGASVTGSWAGSGADSGASTLSTSGSGTVTFETNGIKKPSGLYTFTISTVVKSGYIYDIDGSDTSGQYPPPAQSAPVANGDSYSVDEGAELNVGAPGVLGNDTDAEGDPLTAVLAGGVSHGSLSLSADGSFTYTHDGSETTSDSFTYRANDGTVDSNTATVTITVNPVNDAPTAAGDSASTQQDAAVVVDVLANDSDVDGDTLTVSAVTQGTYGSVTNNGSDVTYSPGTGYTGPDSFTYTVSDGNGGADAATVSITVFPSNDPPTALDDSAVTNEDSSVIVDVLANDSDPDSDPITVSAVGQGANGSVTSSGSDVTYTPDPDFHGSDSFTYDISDGNGGSDTATVSVTVNSLNDDPVASGDSATTDQGAAVVIDVLANDSDADGDTLTVSMVTQGASGTVSTNGSDVTYTHNGSATTSDTFTYTIDDGKGGSDTATVSVTVSPSNSPPVADAGLDQSGAKRENLTFDGSGSSDDGTIVSWEWDFGDAKTGSGEVVVHKFTRNGIYTVTLTVTDNQGATDTDTAVVSIGQ